MRLFRQLFLELDSSTRTIDKVQALERYFATAPASDAVWALYFLMGRKIKRAVNTRLLRQWVLTETKLPEWLLTECYEAVGDLSETIALLLPTVEAELNRDDGLRLSELVEQRILPLRNLTVEQQRELVTNTWRRLDAIERLLWHKLLMGEFRVGVARTLVARAFAKVAGVTPEIMAHRLMGAWQPTTEDYAHLQDPMPGRTDPGQPYPFFLAHPLEDAPDTLGDVEEWHAEWKWDGIRAQLIRREGQILVWSRGEELITDRFPEVAEVGRRLAEGTVLDGEILCWWNEQPLPFAVLQKRIGRKSVGRKLLADAPAIYMAFDLLELAGIDQRSSALAERRALLESLMAKVGPGIDVRLSPRLEAITWQELIEKRQTARQLLVEGVMLKRRQSAYGVGRPRGDWWKWKIDPYSVDAVLIYAQRGHGRRASLYTDYTFGVWQSGELVPIAKAYSGLSDTEIREVDAFIRANICNSFGPVRQVRPELVFELHFEGIQLSRRHKFGIAVRFPRMHRWRKDKLAHEADTLDLVKALAKSTS
jgi:DNA ligase 1